MEWNVDLTERDFFFFFFFNGTAPPSFPKTRNVYAVLDVKAVRGCKNFEIWVWVQADLNVSLSSVSLLWNAADLFSKRTSSTGADFMTPEDIEELLRLDFMALQVHPCPLLTHL